MDPTPPPPPPLPRPAARRRGLVLAVAVAGAAVAALVVVVVTVFQPQRLLVDVEVDERLPGLIAAPGSAPAPMADDPMGTAVPAAPTAIARGEFTARAHPTSGTALLVRRPDGSHLVRLERFRTDNGPDVHVAVSPAAAGSGDHSGLIRLAPLKGNVGDQNYELPRDLDVTGIRSVVIWCERFSVAFGDAPLIAGA